MPALRVVTIVFAFCLAAPAGAATFVANNLSDLNDNNPGDGVCNVGDGSCSFRAAAQEANALPGPDVIELGAGTHVLSQTYNCGGPTCGLYVERRRGERADALRRHEHGPGHLRRLWR